MSIFAFGRIEKRLTPKSPAGKCEQSLIPMNNLPMFYALQTKLESSRFHIVQFWYYLLGLSL